LLHFTLDFNENITLKIETRLVQILELSPNFENSPDCFLFSFFNC